MRRDVFIENDSGGFSVVAADAVEAIIEDGRSDDFGFVTNHKALLLLLYGDDSMPVRVVVDEPLRPDEEAQWLARASWRIDTTDGRMLVMGGFDPDVLSWWKEQGDESSDGRGVGSFMTAPGSWRVDVYAHVGSMNGRVILGEETNEQPGAVFRQSHPGRAFPLWLARMLEFTDEDPGFEHLWKDVRTSMNAGHLTFDMETGDAIGFLVHVTPFSEALEVPAGGWFDLDTNRRMPTTFPLGIPAEVIDPELESFRDKLLDRKKSETPRPIADHVVEVIQVWSGDTLKPVESGSVALPIAELFLLHWMASMTSDSTPRFELWIEPSGPWTPPSSTPDYAVTSRGRNVTAIGAVQNTGGWHTWWTSRSVAQALGEIPDGSTIDFAMAPHHDDAYGDEEVNDAVGRAMYSGTTKGGVWEISEASPKVTREKLDEAIAFTRTLTNGRLQVRAQEEAAYEAAAETFFFQEGSVIREQGVVRVADDDERMLLMLASPVFRARFADQWPVAAEEDLDDDE